MRCIIKDIILVKLKKDIKIGVKINYDTYYYHQFFIFKRS